MIEGIKRKIYDAITNVNIPVCCINIDTKDLVFANNVFKSNLGFEITDTATAPTNFYTYLHPKNREVFDTYLAQILITGFETIELRYLHKYGQTIAVTCNAYIDKGDNNTPDLLFIFGSNNHTTTKSNILQKEKVYESFAILEIIRDAYCCLDNNGDFIFVNQAFESLLNTKQIVGKNIWDVFDGEENSLFAKNYYKSLQHQTIYEFETFSPKINRWLSILIYPSDECISVFLNDITQKKKNNELLIESEKKFHLIADNSPMFIWTIDENLNRTFFNKTFINFSGLSFRYLINNDWLSLVHPDEIEKVNIVLHRCYTYHTEMNFELRLMRHDGVYRWIKINAIPQIDSNGMFRGFLGNGIDITEMKYYYEKIEEKNQESEKALNESRRLSGILNKTSNVLVLTDANGNITWVNEAFTKLTEYKPEEVIGKKPGPLVYGPETSPETIEILHEGINNKEITRVEILNYSKNGRKYWLDLRIEPILKNGIAEGYMAIQIDITKRKNDEMAIKERNDKLKEFSFITSHELRQEFSKMLMVLNLAKTTEESIEDFKSLFHHLETPVNKINTILSKINSGLNANTDQKDVAGRLQELEEIKEICLVDDDQLTNMVHKQIIKIMLPGTPIRVFEDVDSSMSYLKIQPFSNRLIFLDLNFPSSKSGWDFLDEYQQTDLNAPVIILSSSIDNEDLGKSKKYKHVLEYLVKPLTIDVLHKYMRK